MCSIPFKLCNIHPKLGQLCPSQTQDPKIAQAQSRDWADREFALNTKTD